MVLSASHACDLSACPMCSGSGRVSHRLARSGVCLLCKGARHVSPVAAARWVTWQRRNDMWSQTALDGDPNPTDALAVCSKPLQLLSFGACTVSRLDAGGFRITIPSPIGDLFGWFEVEHGRVRVRSLVNALVDRLDELQATLQAACTARPMA